MLDKIRKSLENGGWLNPTEPKPGDSPKQATPQQSTPVRQYANPVVTETVSSTAFSSSIFSVPTEPEQKYLDFVAGELEKINLPGIDSFELGVAMRKHVAKGMPIGMAITTAFDSFLTISPDLSVDSLIASCDHYITKLQEVREDFNREKDSELADLKRQAEIKINGFAQQVQKLSDEETKLNERLKVIAQQRQQALLDSQTEENNLKQATQEVDLKKVNMQLAIVKVSSVIQQDHDAIVQHLKTGAK